MIKDDWTAEIQLDDLPEAHRRLAEIIGVDATLKLCEAYGGATVYVPMLDSIYAEARARLIRAEYNGYNANQLAKRYGCSVRRIWQIVDGLPAKPLDGQVTMFEDAGG